MIFKPHIYQDRAIKHALAHPNSGLFLGMGLGKTVCVLTVLKALTDGLEILRPLIVAPKLVTETTWTDELSKWDHLKGMTISRVIGTAAQRVAALKREADAYIVSRDNIKWLIDYYGAKFPFDMLVIDELSSFKSQASKRFKAVRRIRGKLNRVIGLTGTPAPNGLLDLWAQVYLLDNGERLGRTIGGYRERYFRPDKTNGQVVFSYALREGSEQVIHQKIEDICISMQASDWLDLKPREDIFEKIDLGGLMDQYKSFKKTEVLAVCGAAGGGAITAANAAGLYGKLLQYCNGAVYDEDGNYHVIHDIKLDLLEEKIEALNSEPVIVFYQFKSDAERIMARIKNVTRLRGVEQLEAWNRKEIPVLLAHAASAGHGLNLQAGGHYMIWFGMPWSLELYQQAVARLDRQGQKLPVINFHLISQGTVEELVYKRLVEKELTQQELLNRLTF